MLEYTIRHSGDVTIIDLKGPITLGEALAHGKESGFSTPGYTENSSASEFKRLRMQRQYC
jgi:hypothetical protein